MKGNVWASAALLAVGGGALLGFQTLPEASPQGAEEFPHEAHEGLFPTCEGCHAGAVMNGEADMFPPAASCAECHDGARLERVEWTPPEEDRVSNLRFSHLEHRELAAAWREPATCRSCHAPDDPPVRMRVGAAPPEGCLACHAHAADTHLARRAECDVCHLPLTAAEDLSVERIAGFPLPPSHEEPDFLSGHAPETVLDQVSCGTCHARETCEVCHVNADRLTSIAALGRDGRVALLVSEREAEYPLPETHRDRDWAWDHGSIALGAPARCGNCHTRASCRECHIGEGGGGAPSSLSGGGALPDGFRSVPGLVHSGGSASDPGRASLTARIPAWSRDGLTHPADTVPDAPSDAADVIRSLPSPVPGGAPGVDLSGAAARVHPPDFDTRHASFAATGTMDCTGCHAPQYCADCHAGADSRAFHPDNFMERHATEVFAGAGDCQSCHSTEAFCRDCHVQVGVAAAGTRSAAFHSSEPSWILTHGQAARIGLQSCASCHGQTDCLECHSTAGWGVNPHGPNFDANALAERSGITCGFCHLGGPPGGL